MKKVYIVTKSLYISEILVTSPGMILTRRLKSCLVVVVCLLLARTLIGQDVHFSESPLLPISLNPALAGTADADIRFGGIWRDQWRSVPVPFSSLGLFYDQKFELPFLAGHRWGGGAVFVNDRSGDNRLSWSRLALSLAYHLPLAAEWQATAGFGVEGGQRSFATDLLRFGDQYNGEVFDPDQLTQEDLSRTQAGFFSLNAGFNLSYAASRTRTRLWGGLAASHLNGPQLSFFDDASVTLPRFWRGYAFGAVEVSEKWDATVRAHAYSQGVYREYLAGAGARYHLPLDGQDLTLGLGGGYRWQDAAILYLEALYENWQVGLSYDIHTSAFDVATRGRGGLEIAVQYHLWQPKPPEEFKSCPIF